MLLELIGPITTLPATAFDRISVSFFRTSFSLRGRIARVPFFAYGLLAGFMMIAGIVGGTIVGGYVLEDEARAITAPAAIGFTIAGLALILGLWISLAVTVQRLHDLGLAGAYAILLYALSYGSGLVDGLYPAVATAMNIAAFVGLAILLFKRGQAAAKQYGAVPGHAPVARTHPDQSA